MLPPHRGIGLVAFAILCVVAWGAPPPKEKARADLILVKERDLAYLDADGRLKERLAPDSSHGTLSKDGRWLACLEPDRPKASSHVILRPRAGKEAPVIVPDVRIKVGEGCQIVWSADGRRLLIGESRSPRLGELENTFRVYDLATKKLTRVNLPTRSWVTDWSPDGKRLLGHVWGKFDIRVAWLNADGSGAPEYLTATDENGHEPRLSPDGRKILFKSDSKPAGGGPARRRLTVMDLASNKREVIDEPGETDTYCWSPSGRQVVYTWQRSIDKALERNEREMLLIMSDNDGKKNRKTIARRKYKPAHSGRHVVTFFWVLDWQYAE